MLITGATGAFGQAFVKKLLDTNYCARICIYSRDEYKQALMRESLNDDSRLRFFIGDVRDKERLTRAMQGVSTVIHAAALKRIEVGKFNPSEMVKTNVLGTMNVIEASQDSGVRKVVYLSTDKAYQPISAYGHSKAMGECLMLAANDQVGASGPSFAVTRYGNVAGSTGSVIPKWRNALFDVQITDPNCTRFWMFMDEAVDLVLDTITSGAELAIPTLPAFRLGDLAEAMDLEYDVIGLPDHEKLHEGMSDRETSDTAYRLSIDELKSALKRV